MIVWSIVLIDQHDNWLVRFEFLFAVEGIGGDDKQVSDVRLARRRAIQRNYAAVPRSRDDIRVESFSVIDVIDLDILELPHAGGLQQGRIDTT